MIKLVGSGAYKSSVLINRVALTITAKGLLSANRFEKTLCNFRNNIKIYRENILDVNNRRPVVIRDDRASLFIEKNVKTLVNLADQTSLDTYEKHCLKALGNPEGVIKEVFIHAIRNKLFHLIKDAFGIEEALKTKYRDPNIDGPTKYISLTEDELAVMEEFNYVFYGEHNNASGF